MVNDEIEIEELALELISKISNEKKRFILGITGGPGTGKSTLAESLVKTINDLKKEDLAIYVPMDGFHYKNDKLKKMGLYEKKGSYETFDINAFLELIKKTHENKDLVLGCPRYDRNIHEPVPDAILIRPEHKIIVTEGNYLLLDLEPYSLLKDFFNETWYLECSETETYERLMKRHINGGRTEAQAQEKIRKTDAPNGVLISKSKKLADKVINSEKLIFTTK